MKSKKTIIQVSAVLVVFLLLILFFSAYSNWRNNYHDKTYPGTSVGSLDLSSKTALEINTALSEQANLITESGLTFRYGEKSATIDLISNAFDPDLSYSLVSFNIEATVNKIMSENSADSFFNYLIFKLTPHKKKAVTVIYSLEKERLQELLATAFIELNIPPTNAYFSFENKSSALQINPETIGKEINYDLVFNELDDALEDLDKKIITLKTRSKYSEVKAADLENLEAKARAIINNSGLKLIYKKLGSETTSKLWTIRPEKLVTWLMVKNDTQELDLVLDQEKIATYLTEVVAPEVDVEAVRARFEIKDNKVSTWQKGINGYKVNVASSSEKIMNNFFAGEKEIELVIEEVLSENLNEETTYNIQEIIGIGHSNFAGSSVNRRKNIAVGAEAVNGILLAPGEEFSLVKVLGDVSKETGYFPELVIKGNKTIPEYGGGLCQVATTIFRSALDTGLPITARRNHSYRVSYYEPAGMDAAVYIPNPDVRFVNDTPDYILIQSRIIKDDIYFDFWGKKDGRIATTTTPVIYNIVKPEATKYIETDELAPGEKKCTERAHNGADAYFDYKVIYPEGATTTPIQETRFNSHYVPWREVCLIGKTAPEVETPVEKVSETTAENSAESVSETPTDAPIE